MTKLQTNNKNKFKQYLEDAGYDDYYDKKAYEISRMIEDYDRDIRNTIDEAIEEGILSIDEGVQVMNAYMKKCIKNTVLNQSC